METLIEQLSEEGWKLSEDGYKKLTDDGTVLDKFTVIKKALDIDLRELGGCAFPPELNKGKYEDVSGNMVVQIQKTRNMSAPKSNEESKIAPRMFKIVLTDGSQSCSALEMSPIERISFNTPPGTKLRLKGDIVISHGLLLLNPENVEILGGRVPALVEKWLTNKNLAKQARGRVGAEGGPPPWIPFGQKLTPTHIADKNFKSLEDPSAGKDNEEFEAQRSNAIAEAHAAGGARKVFGGGTKPLLDRNIQAIVSKGFTLQEAEAALSQNRNNVDRALKSLQVPPGTVPGTPAVAGQGQPAAHFPSRSHPSSYRKNNKGGDEKERGGEKDAGGGAAGGGGGGGGRNRRKGGDEESGPKPTGKVSLFQFLEDKLPSLPEKDKTKEKEKEKEWEPPKQDVENKPANKGFPGQEKNRNRDRGPQNNRSSGNSENKRNKEERPPRWPIQKPPRFMNQNRRIEMNNDSMDHFVNRNETHSGNRQSENYLGNKSNNTHFNGYRNNYKVDSLGYNPSGNDYKSQNSNYYKPAGMPNIPEFPYKDNAFIPPLMPSIHSDKMDAVSRMENQFKNFKINEHQYHSNYDGHKPDHLYMNGGKNSSMTLPNQRHQPQNSGKYQWKVGDKCMAKYWEDDVYYNAEVTGISKKTCVVRFLEYGNFEEVLQDDCIPISEEHIENINFQSNDHQGYNNNRNSHFSGSIEFRRGGTRPYIKPGGGGGGGGGGDRDSGSAPSRKPRYSQPVYVPPGSRRDGK